MTDQWLSGLTEEELRLRHTLRVGGRVCLDLCNTVEYRQREQPIEFLKTFGGLVAWSMNANLLSAGEATHILASTNELDRSLIYQRAVMLREAIYQVFSALLTNQPTSPDSLDLLTREWQIAMTHRRLIMTDHRLTLVWDDSITPERIICMVALSAMETLTQENLAWIRQCPNCGWLFIDESRKHNRTWCNMQFCGNRMKARRHYQRQKQQSSPTE